MSNLPVALVVGASRGIGLQLAKSLSECHTVYATCRLANDDLKQLGESTNVQLLPGVDVSKDGGCDSLASEALPQRVDLLVFVAGVLENDTFGDISCESCMHQFNVNALGLVRTVTAVRPRLFEGSRILVMGSLLGSIGSTVHTTKPNRYGYRMSKAAMHACAANMTAEFRPAGIAVGVIHPGVVITDMTKGSGVHATVTPEESVAGILERLAGLNMTTSGTFWDFQGKTMPW